MRKVLALVCALLLFGGVALVFGVGAPTRPADPAAAVRDEWADWTGTGVASSYPTIAAYTAATGKTIPEFHEAPSLTRLVQADRIPPLAQRLPAEPLVVVPAQRIGVYGGTLRDNHLGNVDEFRDLNEEFLLMWDPTGMKVVPNIVKRWEVSADARTFTMYIREGIKWSDGEPFTVDDILFYANDIAWNTELNPAGVRDLTIGGEMGRFEKVDTYTFRVVMPAPDPSFVERMARWRPVPFAPKHYMAQFHPAHADKATLDALVRTRGFSAWTELFLNEWDYSNNPNIPTIFAYKVEGTFSESVQRATRNPYYWKVDIAGNQLPYIDGVNRYNIGDSREALILKTLAGEQDFGNARIYGAATNYAVIRQGEAAGNYRVVPQTQQAPFAEGAIFFNMSHPDADYRALFMDKSFRVALSLAINNARINDTFYEGTYRLSQGFTPPTGPPYHGERDIFQVGMTHEPDRANEMLDALGLTWNPARTIRMTRTGKPLQFTFLVRPRTEQFVPIAEMIKQDWARIGVDITIRPVSGSLWNETVETNTHDIAMDQWNWGGVSYLIPSHRDLAPRDDGWKANPAWGVWLVTDGETGVEPPQAMKDLHALRQEALMARTREDRVIIEKKMYEIHADNVWWILPALRPGDHPQSYYIVYHNRVKNVSVPATDEHRYQIPAAWFIQD